MNNQSPSEGSTPPHPLAELARSSKPEAARALFGHFLPAAVYANATGELVAGMLGNLDAKPAAVRYADDLLTRMNPRDPMEEMLIAQALMAHARVMHLSSLANQQTDTEALRTVNEYADRATNTFRRLMLALAEYRRPLRAGDSFTTIKQANIAGQQVVMNADHLAKENTTNEEGSTHAQANQHAPKSPEALPADARGAGVPPGHGGPRAALGAVHRAADGRGQGPEPGELMETR